MALRFWREIALNPCGRGIQPPSALLRQKPIKFRRYRRSTVRKQEPALNPEKPKIDRGQPAGILVVDDTPANLQVLAGMLKDRGYRVRPVPRGKLALLAARRDPPDLILLDINMPEMSGYEVCERLKADDR